MKNKIIGGFLVLISLFWLWYYGIMVYDHFYYGADSPFHFRPPYWVSLINSIFACTGIIIGIGILKNRLKTKGAILGSVIFLICGFLLDNFGYQLM